MTRAGYITVAVCGGGGRPGYCSSRCTVSGVCLAAAEVDAVEHEAHCATVGGQADSIAWIQIHGRESHGRGTENIAGIHAFAVVTVRDA